MARKVTSYEAAISKQQQQVKRFLRFFCELNCIFRSNLYVRPGSIRECIIVAKQIIEKNDNFAVFNSINVFRHFNQFLIFLLNFHSENYKS